MSPWEAWDTEPEATQGYTAQRAPRCCNSTASVPNS